jgi:hypothetical protein
MTDCCEVGITILYRAITYHNTVTVQPPPQKKGLIELPFIYLQLYFQHVSVSKRTSTGKFGVIKLKNTE